MNITIHYYALMREQAGKSTETIETEVANSRALYQHLCARYPFTLDLSQLRVAINGAFADVDTPLSEGAEVVFIPPVAGG